MIARMRVVTEGGAANVLAFYNLMLDRVIGEEPQL